MLIAFIRGFRLYSRFNLRTDSPRCILRSFVFLFVLLHRPHRAINVYQAVHRRQHLFARDSRGLSRSLDTFTELVFLISEAFTSGNFVLSCFQQIDASHVDSGVIWISMSVLRSNESYYLSTIEYRARYRYILFASREIQAINVLGTNHRARSDKAGSDNLVVMLIKLHRVYKYRMITRKRVVIGLSNYHS